MKNLSSSRIVVILVLAIFIVGLQANHGKAQTSDPSFSKPLPGRGDPLPSRSNTAGTYDAQNTILTPETGVLDWYHLVFQTQLANLKWEIYLASGAGDNPINLSNNLGANDVLPRLNHGATAVVFNSDRDGDHEIYTIQTDGAHLVRLTNNRTDDYGADWSPDNRRIAFVSQRDRNAEIYLMNSDGSSPVRITQDPSIDSSPCWSPDGSQIAWVRYQGDSGTIWIANSDGTQAIPIFSGRYVQHPSWSPDGLLLGFDYDADNDLWNELAVININGSGVETVFDPGASLTDVWMGNWSSDGELLSMTRIQYSYFEGQLSITSAYAYALYLGEESPFRITHGGLDLYPNWQNLDVELPTSNVTSLPGYSRANGFNISWTGNDNGPSGLATFDIQYRLLPSGSWTDWKKKTSESSALFIGPPGVTIAFRSRVRDASGNIEVWPDNSFGDATTTLFTYLFKGQITDLRGAPIPGTNIDISPEPVTRTISDPWGSFLTRLAAEGNHSLTVVHPGYLEYTNLIPGIQSDSVFTFYLPPLDNLILNGGFEDPSSEYAHWSLTGTLPAAQTNGHTGQSSAFLGRDCPAPCLNSPISISGETWSFLSAPTIRVDSSDNIYAFWMHGDGAMYYSRKAPAGTWSTPVPIDGWISGGGNNDIDAVADKNNNIHVVFGNYMGSAYVQIKPDGTITNPVIVGECGKPRLALDSENNLHLLCVSLNSLFYAKRANTGVWSSLKKIGDGNFWYSSHDIVIDPNGVIHIIYTQEGLYYGTLLSDGTVNTQQKLTGSFLLGAHLDLDQNKNIHVVFSTRENNTDTAYYARRDPSGEWVLPKPLPVITLIDDIVLDRLGGLHLIGKNITWDRQNEHSYYLYRKPDGSWYGPTQIDDQSWEYSMTVDSEDRPHIAWVRYTQVNYQTNQTADHPEFIAIQQIVNIPSNIHNPTLSWMQRLESISEFHSSYLSASVSTEVTETKILTASHRGGWNLFWVDLQPWAGQSITLSLTLHQRMGDPYLVVSLDDITLGSWLTPVVSAISPNEFSGTWTSKIITITGANFMQGASVRIGDTTADDVQFIDERTLQVAIPDHLTSGVYDVWVTNSGGQSGILSHGLYLGRVLFLPIIE